MADIAAEDILEHSELKRSITGKQPYLYVAATSRLGIYVLLGCRRGRRRAFWMSFRRRRIAIITGLAYAELVTMSTAAGACSISTNPSATRSYVLHHDLHAVGQHGRGGFAGVRLRARLRRGHGLSEDAVVATLIIVPWSSL